MNLYKRYLKKIVSITTWMLVALPSVICSHGETRDTLPLPVNTENENLDLGYQQLKPYQLAGAISIIKLDYQHTTSVDQLLQGTSAGVTVIQNSGLPGASATVQIRGIHSFAAGNEPLYIIDGFPLYNNNDLANSGFTAGPLLNGLAFLDPQDIASIHVLKDAGATALYGSRASNGVVVIRTKRGLDGNKGIEFSATTGFKTSINKYDLANGSEFASFLNQASTNAGKSGPYSSPTAFGKGTDWQNQILQDNPLNQQYRLVFKGGNDKVSFLLSGSFINNQGLIKNSDFQRLNFHANADARISKNFSLSNSLNLGRIDANTIPSDDSGNSSDFGVISAAVGFNPLLEIKDPEGFLVRFNYQVDDTGIPTGLFQNGSPITNPLAQIAGGESRLGNTRISDYFSLRYEILANLSLTASIGLDAIYNEEFTYLSSALQYNIQLGGIGSAAKMQSLNWINQYLVNYQKDINERHQLGFLVGYSMEGFNRDLLGGESRGFENEALGFHSLSVGKNKRVISNFTEWGMQSLIGKIDYTFAQKYSITVTGRSDASSRFNHKFEFFPTVSFNWHASHEPFIQSNQFISDLSFYLSLGITGNQEIAPYSSFSLLDEFSSARNGSTINGISLSRIGAEELQIEKTTQYNVGTKLSLLDDRLSFGLNIYSYRTDNALLFTPLPSISGFELGLSNVGSISNRGIEFSIVSKILKTNIEWITQFTLGYNKNKVNGLPNNQDIPIGSDLLGISEWGILRTGQSIGSFYGYQSAGIVDNGEQASSFTGQELQTGDRKYKDLNGDGIINVADKALIGKSLPDFNLGLANHLRFKGFDFSFFWQGLIGRDIANFNRFLTHDPTGKFNISASYAKGNEATNPLPRRSNFENVFSDAIIENGSFIRLQNITIGYQFQERVIHKMPFSKLRFFLAVNNIFTISSYNGIDPDVSHFGQNILEQGVDFGGYPKSKILMAGFNLHF